MTIFGKTKKKSKKVILEISKSQSELPPFTLNKVNICDDDAREIQFSENCVKYEVQSDLHEEVDEGRE